MRKHVGNSMNHLSTNMRMAAMALLVSIISAAVLTLSSASFPPAGCPKYCNDVPIPYPFGIGEGCYIEEEFQLTCKTSNITGQLAPHLGGYTIFNISLDGFLIVDTFIAKDCYSGGSSGGNFTYSEGSTPKFPFSVSRNHFTAVGCDTSAFLANRKAVSQFTGCITICNDSGAVTDGECDGVGCCQTSHISKGLLSIEISLTSFYNLSRVHEFDPCSYAFLVDKDSYTFKKADFKDLQKKKIMKTALDWALGNTSCSQPGGGESCKNHSVCVDSDNGPGYRCNCSPGYEGNPYIGCEDVNECNYPKLYPCKGECRNKDGSWSCDVNDYRKVWIPLVIMTPLVIACVLTCICLRRRHIRRKKFFKQNGGVLLLDAQKQRSINNLKIFTSRELEKATKKFSEDRIAGRGGFGTVYKGYLSDNTTIAVKKAKRVDKGQIEQFINEVIILSQINHRNVVRFFGCCLETPVPLLVYEFIYNGTLHDHLHGDPTLPWDVRLKVVSEVAGVLAYLHSAHSVPIIHRDIKPQNILLDEYNMAKLSDFGISKLAPQDEIELFTLVQGTLGYLDPEYMQTTQLTEKSDVYSFGVVLAEVLTGKKAISCKRPEEERNLAMFFMLAFKEGRLSDIVDKRVSSDKRVVEVARIVDLCLRVRGDERPTMKEVAMELERLISLGKDKEGEKCVEIEQGGELGGHDEGNNNACGSTSGGFSGTGDQILLMQPQDGR